MKTIADDLIEEGREDTRSRFARTVLRLLESRFSNLTEEQAKRVLSAKVEKLEMWAPRVLEADSVEDVIGTVDGG